jgi:hypothetical protein
MHPLPPILRLTAAVAGPTHAGSGMCAIPLDLADDFSVAHVLQSLVQLFPPGICRRGQVPDAFTDSLSCQV